MCNCYRITPKKGADKGVRAKVSAAAGKLASSLVRPTDPGIVVMADERVEIMRWGFFRSFNPSINNARSDKLAAGMWAEAFRQRRCVIPVAAFFEWGPGLGGRKQAHEFRDPDDDYLWIAGLWEDREGGRCYTMVTTAASPVMAPIHNRMPAVLLADEVPGFLDGSGCWDFQPFGGALAVARCESPLKRPGPPHGIRAFDHGPPADR
ncbi:MAG: SOS response-associated peptidase family protein [Verrucomicrobia bacterium]|nr:SOS response-associated peptidase family protein [Verrucomicrobiota bacterium]